MPRLNLRVPFAEKDEAKALGANWDPDLKVWYVSDGRQAAPFKKWVVVSVPEESIEINIRSTDYYIGNSERDCWKCKKLTKVYAFMLPAGFQVVSYDDEKQTEVWVSNELPSPLTYIMRLPPHAKRSLAAITKNVFRDYSNMNHSDYWMNHCEHCRALLGDFDTIEDGTAFRPHSAKEAQKIQLFHFAAPFEGSASYSLYDSSMQFFKDMRCV